MTTTAVGLLAGGWRYTGTTASAIFTGTTFLGIHRLNLSYPTADESAQVCIMDFKNGTDWYSLVTQSKGLVYYTIVPALHDATAPLLFTFPSTYSITLKRSGTHTWDLTSVSSVVLNLSTQVLNGTDTSSIWNVTQLGLRSGAGTNIRLGAADSTDVYTFTAPSTVGSSGQFLQTNGSSPTPTLSWITPSSSVGARYIATQQTTSTVPGAAISAGSWVTRLLTNLVSMYPVGTDISLVSGTIRFDNAGSYIIWATTILHIGIIHTCALSRTTGTGTFTGTSGTTTIQFGTTARTGTSNGNTSMILVRYTAVANDRIELQHRCSVNGYEGGAGSFENLQFSSPAVPVNNIFATVRIIRVA